MHAFIYVILSNGIYLETHIKIITWQGSLCPSYTERPFKHLLTQVAWNSRLSMLLLLPREE